MPPIRLSAPEPQRSLSSLWYPKMESLPAWPLGSSSPSLPCKVSLPGPPRSKSWLSAPQRSSSPPRPEIVSLPLYPLIRSGPSWPIRRSSAALPRSGVVGVSRVRQNCMDQTLLVSVLTDLFLRVETDLVRADLLFSVPRGLLHHLRVLDPHRSFREILSEARREVWSSKTYQRFCLCIVNRNAGL